ncbi:MAG: GTP pyrophosphokinase family protein [Parasporobacterium sp.]|nr:GTP pyrophosphokinase family protein [Parasporobacterium sp.]
MEEKYTLAHKRITASLEHFNLVSQANDMLDAVLDYKNMMMVYSCAIKEIRTKLEILDTEFANRVSRNPISSIHTRLKSQTSIIEKMERKGIPVTRDNVEQNLNDIAGLRVICSYIDDIYQIADALVRQDDIELLEKKDYIRNPKPNGYRSLHLIVTVPVFLSDEKKIVKAEVQIRTIAMDFWASLEHGIKYKKNVPQAESLIAELKECADTIAATDQTMMHIRSRMDEVREEETDLDKLYEKLKRFDIQF